METYKRAGFACNCLLGVEMSLSTAAFWAHAFSEPKLSGLLVALLLTAAFGSVSLLASGLVGRLILARETGQWYLVCPRSSLSTSLNEEMRTACATYGLGLVISHKNYGH